MAKILHIPEVEIHENLTNRVLSFFCFYEGNFYCPELDKYREKTLNRRVLQARGGAKGGTKTQNTIREAKANLEGNLKVLNRDEMQRQEEKRFSQKESKLSEHKKWIEALE